jgi:entericidin B
MKAFIAAVIGAAFLFGVAGCNTVEGVGKDVKATGEKVEGEAKEHKKY